MFGGDLWMYWSTRPIPAAELGQPGACYSDNRVRSADPHNIERDDGVVSWSIEACRSRRASSRAHISPTPPRVIERLQVRASRQIVRIPRMTIVTVSVRDPDLGRADTEHSTECAFLSGIRVI